MKSTPRGASSSACAKSSVNLELPPSMTRSPFSSSGSSSRMTESVIWPAGTITQTVRGAGSAATRSAMVATSETSGFVS